MSLLAAALLGTSVALLVAPRGPSRLDAAVPVRSAGGPVPYGRVVSAFGRVPPAPGRVPLAALACALAGVALAVLLAPPLGLVAGLAVALAGPRLLGRLEPRQVRDEREQLPRDLPLLLDLLAACLAGGAPLAAAAGAVADAVPGPAGLRLARVRASLAVGTPPAQAWAALAGPEPDDALGAAARALARAAEGGAPVAATVARVAADARADARARGERAARRTGVLAVAPLGLCFLPAFVLLGVVPVVVGLAGPLLASM